MISEISLPDTPVEFSITYKPPLPVVLGAGQYTEVEVTFSPNATQLYTGFLLITSDDPDESLFPVTLSGNGVIADTPSEQVAYVINFIQESISTGALTGEGSGNSADKKVNALMNMIKASGDLLAAGQTVEGCQQLADLYLKVDGVSPPPDFVSGEATVEPLVPSSRCGCTTDANEPTELWSSLKRLELSKIAMADQKCWQSKGRVLRPCPYFGCNYREYG